jgi:hypothetical protein
MTPPRACRTGSIHWFYTTQRQRQTPRGQDASGAHDKSQHDRDQATNRLLIKSLAATGTTPPRKATGELSPKEIDRRSFLSARSVTGHR